MSSIYEAPPEPGDEARRWAEASCRVRHQLEHGPRVRGVSTQLALLILIVFLCGLAVVARFGEPVTPVIAWQLILVVGALIMGGIGYVWAKRGGRLLPQIPTPRRDWPLSPLLPDERRSLARQIRGRVPPTEQSRELVADLIANARLNNRAALPSLGGFLLFLFSESLYLGWPWPLAIAGLLVFVLIVMRVEARRWRRALQHGESTSRA